MKKRKVFLINMERGGQTDSVCERLCEVASPLLPVEVDDPYEGVYVLLVNSDKDRIEKLSELCESFWCFYLDVRLIRKNTFMCGTEYVLVTDQGLPVMEDYVALFDEKHLKKLIKKLDMLSQAGLTAKQH